MPKSLRAQLFFRVRYLFHSNGTIHDLSLFPRGSPSKQNRLGIANVDTLLNVIGGNGRNGPPLGQAPANAGFGMGGGVEGMGGVGGMGGMSGMGGMGGFGGMGGMGGMGADGILDGMVRSPIMSFDEEALDNIMAEGGGISPFRDIPPAVIGRPV